MKNKILNCTSVLVIALIAIIQTTSALANKKESIAVLELQATGVDKDLATNLSEILVAEVDRLNIYKVIGKSEIKAMLGFEEEKQILACSDDTGCLAEIGGALGVEKIIIGSIGKISNTFVVNIKLVNIKKAEVEKRFYETVKGDAAILIETIKTSAAAVFENELKAKKAAEVKVEPVPMVKKATEKKTEIKAEKEIIEKNEIEKKVTKMITPETNPQKPVKTVEKEDSILTKWWFWTVVAVAAGTATGTAVYAVGNDDDSNSDNGDDYGYTETLNISIPDPTIAIGN